MIEKERAETLRIILNSFYHQLIPLYHHNTTAISKRFEQEFNEYSKLYIGNLKIDIPVKRSRTLFTVSVGETRVLAVEWHDNIVVELLEGLHGQHWHSLLKSIVSTTTYLLRSV